jgi:glycosyltransferase involved in cell wall biosynthesis
MGEKPKKILFISYHYPPSTAIGGMRIYGNSKYLARFGWAIYILTVKNKHIQEFDYERGSDDRRIEVHRVFNMPKISTILLNAIKKIKSNKKLDESGKGNGSEINNSGKLIIQNDEQVIDKIKRILDSFLLLPDENRNWIIPAVLRAASVIQKNNIEVLFTTAPPFSSSLIGLLLKKMFNIKWIADFRDPWIKPFNKILYPTCQLSVAIENFLENAVIRNADLVVTTTPILNKEYKKIFIKEKENKFIYLPNGYDKEFYDNVINEKKYKQFTISYTGTLYYGRSPEPIFKALKLIREKNENIFSMIKFKLVGDCTYSDGIKTIDLVNKYSLEDVVAVDPNVSFSESIEINKKSHMGLVLAPDQKYQIPAKIYDLIGTKTTVLAITGEGATKELVEKYGIGKCFEGHEIHNIARFITEEMKTKNTLKINWSEVSNIFEKSNIIKKLSTELEGIYNS